MTCDHATDLALDALYDELEAPVRAAFDAHLVGCVACRSAFESLARARGAAALAPVAVPADLEAKILARVAGATSSAPSSAGSVDPPLRSAAVVPLRRRALAAAASWAMRPQTAMAATFLLVVGSSVALLQTRKSGSEAAAVAVREEGQPAPAAEAPPPPEPLAVATVAAPGAPRAATRGPADDRERRAAAEPKKRADDALALRESPDPRAPSPAPAAAPAANAQGALGGAIATDHAEEGFGRAAGGGAAKSSVGPADLLAGARATRDASGCQAALPLFERVAQTSPGTRSAHDATLEAARCYRVLGQADRARDRYASLLGVGSHEAIARAELGSMGSPAGHAAAKPAPARAAPAAPTSRPPASADGF